MGINLEVKFVGDKVVDLPDSCSCGPGTGTTAFIIIYYELSYPCCCLMFILMYPSNTNTAADKGQLLTMDGRKLQSG